MTAINSQNTEPPLPKVHAEEDSSSVLMPTTPQASTPIAPVAPPQEPMIVTPSIEVSPVQVQSPSLIAEEKATATPSSLQKEEEKLINESSSSSTPASPDALNIPQGPSLFDHLMNEDEPVVTATATPVGETPAAFSFENPTLPEAPQKSSQETSSAVETKVSVTTPSPKSPMTSTTHYSTPREFIEKSLENIEVMLETIDKRHGSKMTEAE